MTLPAKTLLLLLITTAPLLLLLSGCSTESVGEEGGFPSPAVSVADVVVREITSWEQFSGRIEAKEAVQIRPRVKGIIEKVHYREGDIVKKGDLLFTIDQQPFRVELNRAEADLARAHTQAELTQVESRRAKNLLTRKLLSQDEYDQRIAAEHQAKSNVRAAEATVQLAQLNLEYTEIRSPINGRSGRALITKGNLISSSPTPDLLTTILSLDPVYVTFDSDELTYLSYFGDAQPSAKNNKRTVFIGLSNEQGFPRKGYIDFVDNQLDPNTGTIRLRAVLDNKDQRLLPGLFVRIKLLAPKSEQAILIADHAILTDQDRKYVYILGEENQAMRRDVKTGRTIDGLRMINEGLNPGEQVIVHGIQKVFFPNMPVVPQVIGMTDPPSSPEPMPAAEH